MAKASFKLISKRRPSKTSSTTSRTYKHGNLQFFYWIQSLHFLIVHNDGDKLNAMILWRLRWYLFLIPLSSSKMRKASAFLYSCFSWLYYKGHPFFHSVTNLQPTLLWTPGYKEFLQFSFLVFYPYTRWSNILFKTYQVPLKDLCFFNGLVKLILTCLPTAPSRIGPSLVFKGLSKPGLVTSKKYCSGMGLVWFDPIADWWFLSNPLYHSSVIRLLV